MNNESKRVALTTETLCRNRQHRCPKEETGTWVCTLYQRIRIKKRNKISLNYYRLDQCKIDFPGVIVMTGMKG